MYQAEFVHHPGRNHVSLPTKPAPLYIRVWDRPTKSLTFGNLVLACGTLDRARHGAGSACLASKREEPFAGGAWGIIAHSQVTEMRALE